MGTKSAYYTENKCNTLKEECTAYYPDIFIISYSHGYLDTVLPVFKKRAIFSYESSWSYGSWIYNYLCNKCLSPLTLGVAIPLI